MKTPTTASSHSSEFSLVDYLERTAPRRHDKIGLICHLSRLQPYNRRPHHIRVAYNTFDTLLGQFEGKMFSLRNNDIVFIGHSSARDKLNEAIVKMRYLFSSDPLIVNKVDDLSSVSSFATWFQLDRDYDNLMEQARRMYHATQTGKPQNFGDVAPVERVAINPDQLGWLEDTLANADLTNLVRNQPICAIAGDAKPTAVFHELYVSIQDLEKQVVPGVDLSANRWLFQYLTGVLDKRMLVYLAEEGERSKRAFSFNMNVSSLLSSEFAKFDQRVSSNLRGRLVIELQTVDVFSDMAAYMFARDFVMDRGYRICLDGLTQFTASFVDRSKLAFDFVKMYWNSAMQHEDFDKVAQSLRGDADSQAMSRVILARCDSPEAIEIGKKMGISLFQGREVDKMIRASENHSLVRGPR
jgi:hypothetical protein